MNSKCFYEISCCCGDKWLFFYRTGSDFVLTFITEIPHQHYQNSYKNCHFGPEEFFSSSNFLKGPLNEWKWSRSRILATKLYPLNILSIQAMYLYRLHWCCWTFIRWGSKIALYAYATILPLWSGRVFLWENLSFGLITSPALHTTTVVWTNQEVLTKVNYGMKFLHWKEIIDSLTHLLDLEAWIQC